ncbi:ATP-dependent zinc metalloprotease FtsH [Saccharicrinis fermentans]|uniref:ATP-dependent zinc metalloprotease FtsH n=1 Tax=Saccharicrinis fermentans DSM 9555 = JCM 21142 TaxID=869213 RepID=W7Y131_9BACT|nr:ATP-dependent zinc metalloprotease FtsH [Saccharicrinis fermentans]GAF01662.1 ATP-dependent zinc metalloprotease FtsH 3 [Saccharicrinis fermentans DSM 9555 = JCM 21142]
MSEEQKQKNEPVNQGGNNSNPKFPKFNGYWIYGIILLLMISFFMVNQEEVVKKMPYSKFTDQVLPSGDIEMLTVITNESALEVTIKSDKLENYRDEFGDNFSSLMEGGPHFLVKVPSVDSFVEDLRRVEQSQQISIPNRYEQRSNYFNEVLSFLWPLILLLIIWVFIFRRMGAQGGGGGAGNIFNVGKSRAKVFDKESNINVNFLDVAGLAEAKQELEEIVSFLKRPEKYTNLGGKIPKGALLVGPPGTGKTLLAKAVAGEANVPFFSMSGSDFVEMFVGVGASRVRDLFKKAKEKAPCIVFIDEIDAIGRARGKSPSMGANDERENTLNQLLTEMDGFGTNSGVIILAATNRADILDRALMRAGRFDRQIHVELPDINERKQIFEVHLRPLKLSEEVKSEFLAKQTPGFSGADIANVCNEAALIAARGDKTIVEKEDFLSAVDRIVGGLEKKNKIISKDEKRAIAYHEAGHAATSWLLEYAHPLVKVTIVPRGKALGAAWYLPEERQLTTTEQMLDEMCSALAGRAAEELEFGKISTGALNDLEKVTKQAYAMIAYYGMGRGLGNVSYFDSSGQNEYGFTKPYSEDTAQVIDQEVSKLIEEQYQRAKDILRSNKDKHAQLANLLLEREVIFSEDLEAIFGKRKVNKHIVQLDDNGHESSEAPKSETDQSKDASPDTESEKE